MKQISIKGTGGQILCPVKKATPERLNRGAPERENTRGAPERLGKIWSGRQIRPTIGSVQPQPHSNIKYHLVCEGTPLVRSTASTTCSLPPDAMCSPDFADRLAHHLHASESLMSRVFPIQIPPRRHREMKPQRRGRLERPFLITSLCRISGHLES